jgi:hypothetical protein
MQLMLLRINFDHQFFLLPDRVHNSIDANFISNFLINLTNLHRSSLVPKFNQHISLIINRDVDFMLMRILIDEISLHIIGLSTLLVSLELSSLDLFNRFFVLKVVIVLWVTSVMKILSFFSDDTKYLWETFLVLFNGNDSEFVRTLSFDHCREIIDKSENGNGTNDGPDKFERSSETTKLREDITYCEVNVVPLRFCKTQSEIDNNLVFVTSQRRS